MTSPFQRLLVANRGEIACRIIRAGAGLGIETIAVHTSDDTAAPHVALADRAEPLPGVGVAGYLDIGAVIAAARSVGADALHPGYGFLAENPALAAACDEAGVTFVGPTVDQLELFGDKTAARHAATDAGIPVLAGTDGPATKADAAELLAEHGAVMLKAVAGGGGRGMRAVADAADLDQAWTRCRSEATSAFGRGDLYVEQLVVAAHHVEVQIIGDGTDVTPLGERDCSVQRRNQKLVEIAPAPTIDDGLRATMGEAATALGRAVGYRGVGTIEFLVDAGARSTASQSTASQSTGSQSTAHDSTGSASGRPGFWFIEANARIQVEHTVTEEVTGVDLVETQLRIAAGAGLTEVGLAEPPPVRGWAIQARINAETIAADGTTRPSTGTVGAVELASGPGVRIDAALHTGMTLNPNYDSLLAKLIVSRPSGSFDDVAAKLYRALCECHVDGVATNLDFLRNLAASGQLGSATTNLVADRIVELTTPTDHPVRHRQQAAGSNGSTPDAARPEGPGGPSMAGARLESSDPLAVIDFGRGDGPATSGVGTATDEGIGPATAPIAQSGGVDQFVAQPGLAPVVTPLQGTVVSMEVAVGDAVREGQLVAVVEAMKMEHEITASSAGTVERVVAAPGDTLWAQQLLAVVAIGDGGGGDVGETEEIDLDEIRPSLAEAFELRAKMMDDARPDAVDRRRKTGQRTARENLADLIDDGTFVEYGPVALAAQRRRRSRDDLIARSPADGLITGVASVNGGLFAEPTNRCAVMIYDYTVFAGTQGIRNHAKTDRIIDVAVDGRMPFILYAEGGGGRPGDTDGGDFGSRTFSRFATMSGLIPIVGVVSGYCFAGNASLLGCCDVIIATRNSNIGMGGPAMIEGGGLGIFRPEEIGPSNVHVANGVIDVLVEDEAEATEVAKKYLAYFQGPTTGWEVHDQRLLRRAIPENRLRSYDVRELITTLADVDSVLELRPGFGHGIVTALIRIEGRPVGLVANNPNHLGGAIDSDGADKGARFMQLCDAFDVPVLFLCDTPGIMVGPEVEKTALVRHANRMFLIGANLEVPTFTVIVRKAYGLGGIAMAGGSFKAPMFSVAWPTAEFGPMGLEGSVKLGFRAELAAIEDPEERKARYDELVDKEYKRGKALNHATGFAIDDAIDPAETRHWLANILASLRPPPERFGKKRAAVDGW
jgi:acetyl/propionyl-CoA carboxylase alpha subunit/acetyl-CoA carboxylase carboxyltransferase component